MLKKMFFGGATFLCLSFVLCTKIGSAQSCQSGANGLYSYSAIGIGIPGALLTTSTTTSTSAYSNTPLGQLLAGVANTGPFASSGTLSFDTSGNISASSAAQGGTTMLVGTYLLNADCTIAVTLSDTFGTNKTVTGLQGIVLNNGAEINLGALQTVSTGSASTTGAYQSNLLIKLVRPLATYCSVSDLNGAYGLTATGTRVAALATNSGGTTTLTVQTEVPYFLFGRVQFDGNGTILAPTTPPSPLGYLQLAGSYAVNSDCTGTMTVASINSTSAATPANTSLTVPFVLTRASVQSTGARPVIEFSQSTGAQTLFGRGQAQ